MSNSLPFLSGFTASITIGEEAANLAPQLIDSDVTFVDADNNFDGGSLVLSGLLADDIIGVRDQGTGAGEIGISGSNISFAGTIIGTMTGGAGTALSVTFNASATSASIEALIENLTFSTLSDTPTAARTLDLTITDAAGAKAAAPITVAEQTGSANPFNGIDPGSRVSQSFADLDGDGDLDLVIGSFDGTLKHFRNTGTVETPVYTEITGLDNPFGGIDAGFMSTPSLADLDSDGDLDLVIGNSDGILIYYRNTGTSLAPVYSALTGAANPFDGIDVGGYSNPSFADLDGDGDFDLVVGDRNGTISYFENTGDGIAPAYTERTGVANPFDGIDVGDNSAPGLADLDGDGDLDLIAGESGGTIDYYENTGTRLAPIYVERTGLANPFSDVSVSGYSTPSFADLDRDGDLDLMIGIIDGTFAFFSNTTNDPFAERTGVANPFDGIDIGSESTPTFSDMDGDGDLDLIIGESDGNLNYYENTGTGLAPVYTVRTGAANLFNGIDIGFVSTPCFADLDGDGDLDLVIGESDGNLNYYENTGTSLAPVFTERTGAANPFDGVDIASYSSPNFADLDGDGDLDLVIGDRFGNLNYYENTGTTAAPAYTKRTGAANLFDGIDIGNFSIPSLADLDGDGDLDLVIGENDGNLNYYENTGTALAPSFTERAGAANPFNGIDIGVYSAPTFADLDGDGDLDLVIGESLGTLNYYQNTTISLASAYTERTGAANPFDGFDVGDDSNLAFADLDGDGDLDLVTGEYDGNLNYYENTGTGLVPAYTVRTGAANPFNGIDIGLSSAPSFADLDGDGDLDMVVGDFDGFLNYYENTGTGLVPAYTVRTGAANPFNGIDIGFYSKPSLADLDGDGDLDLVIGESDGNLNYFENTGTALAPVYTERTGAANPFNGIDIGFSSAPSFADLDGDGDLDLVIGEFDGNLNYFENTGTSLAPVYAERTGAANTFNGIVIGFSSAPSFADMDGDGDLDLIIGEAEGNLNHYENTGTGFQFLLNVTQHTDPSNNDDVITGTAGNDTIDGLGGNDTIRGLGGNDTLIGGIGNDTLEGGAGRDSYDGGSGSDTVSFAGAAGWVIDLAAGTATTLSGFTTETLVSIENIIGSDGNDTITGTNRANDLDGGGGDDTLIGGGGIDNFFGGTGTDTVDLSGGNSKWRVDLGNDTAQITSVAGTVYDVDFADIEIVIGARNTNTVIGTAANETVTGQSFSDVFYTGEGLDQFDAGLGFDTISLGSASEGLTVRGTAGWAKTAGGATVVNFTGVENLSGTSHNDNMTGTSGTNILDGRAGDDTLNAGSGNDTVRGQAGDDHLTGGGGNDVIDGGADIDRAYFSGDSTDYAITKSGATTTVEWTGAGSGDGTDTLTNVEFLVFNDTTIDVLLI